ncbi:PQQ-dependent sugar dehydrogenase [Roseibacillus ishigakijimensis]|nr:PQQ-dependent sugar dehydrogenase [Roseibacillus ishigakijimensis]
MFRKVTSAALLGMLWTSASPAADSAAVPSDDHFRVETLVSGLVDAMEIAPLPDGRVLIAERTGALKLYTPGEQGARTVHHFEVSVRNEKAGTSRETGLLGVTADPDFSQNGWIYCYYSPQEPSEHWLTRWTLKNGRLEDEKVLLTMEQSREVGVCHEGGSLAFDGAGNLFLSTGDNTNPFKSNGYAPLDEREGNESINSQRTAGNTNDLRGKVLRITPTDDGSYTIPEGNLFPPGTEKTRPEIYAMGCRNPWRIGVDQRTNTLYWGDVGPDARKTTSRGPNGYCEINQAATAGYYGWPYFVGANEAYARYDFAAEKVGEKFDPAKPLNESRLNDGLEQLPPAREPFWFVSRSSYCAGPVYYHDDFREAESKLPPALDRCLITYDWNNGHMQLSKLAEDESLLWKTDWLHSKKFVHPSDVELAADGSLYILEYGSKWYDGTDGKLKRVTYSSEPLQSEPEEADPRLAGISSDHPGYGLLAEAICLSCHQTQEKSIGPSYAEVAMKYRGDEQAVDLLAKKISQGGVGVWGEVPMPPNPQYNEEQLSQMVDAILSLAPEEHTE